MYNFYLCNFNPFFSISQFFQASKKYLQIPLSIRSLTLECRGCPLIMGWTNTNTSCTYFNLTLSRSAKVYTSVPKLNKRIAKVKTGYMMNTVRFLSLKISLVSYHINKFNCKYLHIWCFLHNMHNTPQSATALIIHYDTFTVALITHIVLF